MARVILEGRPSPGCGWSVLLTATVRPPETISNLTRRDPDLRLSDYSEALRHWAAIPNICNIIWCDNSGLNDKELANMVRCITRTDTHIELHSFPGNTYDPGLGKGRGEMEILAFAISAALRPRGYSHILKVTGRLSIANGEPLVRRLIQCPQADVCCDLQQYLTYADGRAFWCSTTFLEDHLIKYDWVIDDSRGAYFEHALARAVHSAAAQGFSWRPLPLAPEFRGYSGTSGTRLASGLFHKGHSDIRLWLKRRILAR